MENEELLNNIFKELNSWNQTQLEISRSIKILVRESVEKRLAHIFSSPYEFLIYQLSDGQRPSTEIAKLVPISKKTILKIWQKWEELGIVETEGYKNPYRAKYSLEELALIFGEQQNNENPKSESDG
ncbi:MAG: hypothetical protein PWQ55_118 [Chloroflexota bacterium]|nr:hypothetical protein [Chloroflexota bacterium]